MIRLLSSSLPNEAIEAVVCSKCFPEAIGLLFRKTIVLRWTYCISIVPCGEPLLRENPQVRLNIQISLLLGQIFFVISPVV